MFSKFFLKLDIKPLKWEDRIVLFTGYLINEGRRAGTVKSYISAIKSVLLEDGIRVSVDKYILNSLTKACRYHNHKVKLKLPIQKVLLHSILKQVDKKFGGDSNPQPYLQSLYKAMFISAYYGLLRVGEVAQGDHPVLVTDALIGTNKDKILFILRTSKMHWLDDKPQSVMISSEGSKSSSNGSNHKTFCPFRILRDYIDRRPKFWDENEPFFTYRDRSGVKSQTISKILKEAVKDSGLNPQHYSMHGFRAGRSVDLLELGVSVETIKKLGRWKSNSIFTYLKYV